MGLRDVLTKTMFPRLQRYLLPFALTAGCGSSTSETTTPSSYVHYEKKTSDAQGQATFGGGAAVQVRDEAGKALENITIHYLSKGERNTFIAVDQQGKYFPERIAARGRASRIRQQLYRRSPLDKLEEIVLELVCETFSICDTVETITTVLEETEKYEPGDVLGEDGNVNKYCQTREQILTNTIDVPAGIIILPATAAGYPAEKIKNSATTKLKNLAEKYILARYGDQPGYEVWVPKRAMSICGKEYDSAVCDLSDGQLGQLWNTDLPYWQIVGGCQPRSNGGENDGGTSVNCQEGATWADLGTGAIQDCEQRNIYWQQARAPQPLSWPDADAYCRNLELGGLSGWRLPTEDEFQRLLQQFFKKGNGLECCPVAPFEVAPLEGSCGRYWTADNWWEDPKYKTTVGFGTCSPDLGVTSQGYYVRCLQKE